MIPRYLLPVRQSFLANHQHSIISWMLLFPSTPRACEVGYRLSLLCARYADGWLCCHRRHPHKHVPAYAAGVLSKAGNTSASWTLSNYTSAATTIVDCRVYRQITTSALIASVGDAKSFKNGRQLAAWLGLVPRQHSSGGKQTLLGISKRGDSHLRPLLIHGARAVLRVAERKAQHANSWLAGVMGRRNHNVAAWHSPTRMPA